MSTSKVDPRVAEMLIDRLLARSALPDAARTESTRTALGEMYEVRPAEHTCAYCGQDEVEYRYREKPEWWGESGPDGPRWDRWYCACGWAAGLRPEEL